VGNVLNSVSVSATLIRDRLRDSRLKNLCRVTEMLRDHRDNLAGFLTADPKASCCRNTSAPSRAT